MSSKQRERLERQMTVTTLGMLIDFYGADMRLKNRTDDSIRTNLSHLRRFAAHSGGPDVKLADLTPDVAQAYVEALQARQSKRDNHSTRPPEHKPLSPYSISKTVKILRGFGAWMARDGLGNPFEELDIPTVPKTLVETLTPEEVRKLLEAINPNTPNGARNYAMVLLMLDSGPRVSEVAELRIRHLDLQDRQAMIMGKGRKERTIPFVQQTAGALMRYLTTFRPQPVNPEHDHVFLSVDGYPMTRNSIECVIRRLRDTSGVHKLHAHLLRHTFAVNFLAAGGDLETLRRILGHESLEVTKRYLSGLQAAQIRAMYNEFSPMDRMEVGSGERRFSGRGIVARRANDR